MALPRPAAGFILTDIQLADSSSVIDAVHAIVSTSMSR